MTVIERALATAVPPVRDRSWVLMAVGAFKAAYDAMQPPAILACFAPDAVFLGTTQDAPSRDGGSILAYFEQSAAGARPKRVEFETALASGLGDDAVLIAGQQRFFRLEPEGEVSTPARFSLILARTGQRWLIAHFHSSRLPGGPPAGPAMPA